MCYPPVVFECVVEKISTLSIGFYELEEPFGYLHINGNDIYWYEMKYSSDTYPLKLPISDKLIKKSKYVGLGTDPNTILHKVSRLYQ